MTLSDLGALGEFVSAVAVLLTLIYLAVQTRQTKDATLQMYWLNRVDQRIRGLWADRDSPYMANIFVKVSRGEQLDQEDIFRISQSLQVELVRVRAAFGLGVRNTEQDGTLFGGLRQFVELVPDLARERWRNYVQRTGAAEAFISWVEDAVPEIKTIDA